MRANLVVALAVLGCGACQTIDSTEVRTGGIYIEVDVFQSGTSEAQATATLRTGGELSNTYLRFAGADRLVAMIAGQSYVFWEDSRPAFWGVVQYDVAFPYPTVDTELTIAFERGADDVSALGSKVVLPALFATTPLAATSYSRANDTLDLHWAPFDETAPVDWLLSGSCLLPVRQDGAIDSGTVHIAPGTLRKPRDQDLPPSQQGTTIPDECIAQLSVTKQRGGRIDPAFAGGSFTARQQQWLAFTSVP